MRFPTAAVIEITGTEVEPVTEDVEEVVTIRYGFAFQQRENEPTVVVYADGEDYHRFDFVAVPEEVGGTVTGQTGGTDVVIRAITASDAVDLSPAGVPQPVDVIEAHILQGGGMLAGEVDAAVAADNSVVTLVLDTGLGLYVRYSGDWQLLPETSSSLDGLALHMVAPESLDIWDAADAAAQPISIFDLPRSINNYYTDASDQEPVAEAAPAGPTIAAIESLVDLNNVGRMQSGSWYTRKRAQALRGTGGRDQVITAAADYMTAMQSGINADPTGVIRRDIIRRARAAGLLAHPVIVAALDWREWLHPRGRDGKFITTGPGRVKVFNNPTPGMGDKGEFGRVKELTERGVLVEMLTPTGKTTGETRLVSPKLIEVFNQAGNLDPTKAAQAATPEQGGEGKAGTLADTFPQSV